MDIQVIEDNIRILEDSETTVETVEELANLYTVYDRLKYKQPRTVSSQDEFNDILPAFNTYIEARRQNQLGNTNEELVQHSLKLLCQELKEFIETLYANTGSRKERLSILYLTKELYEKFNR